MCEDFSILKDLKIPSLQWKEISNHLSATELDMWCEKIPELNTFILSVPGSPSLSLAPQIF